jgi:CheY-like chemotaxis protein
MTILVAEDDEDDFFFTARVLRKSLDAKLFHVESGRTAIEYLMGQGSYTDRAAYPWPDVMFLDLKMDDIDGHAVLSWIRENTSRAPIRIFVLTGSGEMRDRERVQATGVAEGYIVKPLTTQHVASIFGVAGNAARP